MHSVWAILAALGLADVERKMKWAKKNLPEDVYDKINKSIGNILKRTLSFILLIDLPLVILAILFVGGSFYKAPERPVDSAALRIGYVGYEQNLRWTYNKKAYDEPLSKYGLDVELPHRTAVYIDVREDGSVIDVTLEDPYASRENHVIVGVTLLVFACVVTCVMAIAIRKKRFARPWCLYAEAYDNDMSAEDICELIRKA